MRIAGVIVANLTPMDATGQALDLAAAQRLAEFLVGQRVGGLFVNGTTGEGPLLSTDERKRHAEAVIAAVGGRIPVIVHVGAITTAESIDLAQHAQAAGADAIACVTPYFFGYSERELEAFYRRLAQAVPALDVYLYSIPSRAGNAISPALAERLSNEANIVGIKDSSGSIGHLLELLAIPNLVVLPGADLLAIPALEAGAAGMVSGPAGIFPEPYVALWEAWQARDYAAVIAWQQVIRIISRAVQHGARIDLLKALADLRLPGTGSVRAPLSRPDDDELRALRAKLYTLLATTPLPKPSYEWLS
jgi:dihydrodipicolinate synthase/N-acetylneuraminate lyase